jgi:8-oxo-dGTP pyrophosphatase MutT (NUDIX family)
MVSEILDGRHQVVGAMLVRADAVLLSHRSVDREWFPDVWDHPGGHAEANETPTQAVAREVREEIGVTLGDELAHLSFSLATDEIGWFTAKRPTVNAACRFCLPPLDHGGAGF